MNEPTYNYAEYLEHFTDLKEVAERCRERYQDRDSDAERLADAFIGMLAKHPDHASKREA